MKVFSKKSLSRLESIAPHLVTRINFVEESDAKFQEYLVFEQRDIYVCFGCGYPPKGAVGQWILIEPSLERLRAFLLEEESERFFERDVLVVCLEDEVSLRQLSWRLFDKSFALIDGGYSDFSAFATRFMHRIEGTAHLFNEYSDFGVLPIKNTLKNLLEPLSDPASYQGAFNGCDAVIIGAGPSLNERFEEIKKIEKNVVLIGCGSAVQVLKTQGIELDFATYLDPAPPLNRYEQLQEKTPLVFLSRTAPAVVSHFTGTKLLVGSNECHPLEMYILEQAGIDQKLQGGWNAASLGIEWAEFIGCSRIFTLGVDNTPTGYVEGISDTSQRSSAEVRETQIWFEGIPILPKEFTPKGKKGCVQARPLENRKSSHFLELEEGFRMAEEAVDGLLRGGRGKVLYTFELEQNIVYEYLLCFLWEIWKNRFKNPSDEEKWSFYRKILDEYQFIRN